MKENFDVEKVVGYFLDGKLHSWLESHYYEEIADVVSQIDKNDVDLAKKLCEIFEIEYTETETIDAEKLMERNERIEKLKQFTDDEEIIKNVHLVAFNQEELADLYDNEETKIYLCEGDFDIPKSKQDLEYIVIGDVKVTGLAKSEKILETGTGITIERFDLRYDLTPAERFDMMMAQCKQPLIDKVGEKESVRLLTRPVDWDMVIAVIENGPYDPTKSLIEGLHRSLEYIFSPFNNTDDNSNNERK